ncbi:hypothetical protein ABIB57_005269 [Devosia sp. UYZn731]|uniref:hypothetical protein n=1 Tax=Devosia sp. UYZn731 TaxID=3156345 RepID=UPI003394145A
MIKSAIIALVAVAAMGSVAAPAFADNDMGNSNSNHADGNYLDTDAVLARLHEQGVNATSVEHWGTLVRAFVIQSDGTKVSQLFTPDTLKPVAL